MIGSLLKQKDDRGLNDALKDFGSKFANQERLLNDLAKDRGENAGLSKALIHDLDARFANQDKMINYLVQQLGSLESSTLNTTKRVADLQERDRETVNKKTNDLKFNLE